MSHFAKENSKHACGLLATESISPFKLQVISQLTILMALTLLCTSFSLLDAHAQDHPFKTTSVRNRTSNQAKETTIDELFKKVDLPVAFLRPVLLEGVKIPELTPDSVRLLGQNYFVVAHNSPFTSMAQLYRANRIRGKSNFVTADCIVHPYFAFTNDVIAKTIESRIAPDLSHLLRAMLASCEADYKNADDTDVRTDVTKNIAFLSVALKLLDPSFTQPAIQSAQTMVATELGNIAGGTRCNSAVFEREEDFSVYEPLGWYNSSEQLKRFYRCREWLSRGYFPLTDTHNGAGLQSGNSFRRSVLLFRSLDLAKCQGTTAFELWSKLEKAWRLLGASAEGQDSHTLLPPQYRAVFGVNANDLKVTLSRLSEPFFRTKLLLSIRRQKPVELGSTSVLDMDAISTNSKTSAVFRFLPSVSQPELDWLRKRAHGYQEDIGNQHCCPLALLTLHAYGAPQATNTLADKASRLDPWLSRFIPQLERINNLKESSSQQFRDWRWAIVSSYFKPFGGGAQNALRTEQYLTHQLESAFAGWVDSHIGIVRDAANSSANSMDERSQKVTINLSRSIASNTVSKAPSVVSSSPVHIPARLTNESALVPTRPPRKQAQMVAFHYLEPNLELFQRIKAHALQLLSQMEELGYSSEEYKERCQDFIRLCQRLESIAERELKGQPLLNIDKDLLGNIDSILEKISPHTEGTLYLNDGNKSQSDNASGATLGLGRPGLICVIMQTNNGAILCRGAVYTYYEVAGGPFKPEHWARKLDYGLLRPPFWTSEFDVVQPTRKTTSK